MTKHYNELRTEQEKNILVRCWKTSRFHATFYLRKNPAD